MSYFEACRTVKGITTEPNLYVASYGGEPSVEQNGIRSVAFETEYCAEGSSEAEARKELAQLIAGKDGTPGPITVTKRQSFWETLLSILGEAGNTPCP